LVGDLVGAEDLAFDDSGLFGFGDVGDALREDGIAIVDSAVLG
jgi:hypothetical protein